VHKIFVINKMDVTEWLKNEEVQRHFRKAGAAVMSAVYNEIYLYLWFICIYTIFLLIVMVTNMYLLIRFIRYSNTNSGVFDSSSSSSANRA
jgi:hypothetical protein